MPPAPFLTFSFYTGLRLGDCALLRREKIDRVNGLIVTRSAKTDEETRTRINPALVKIIEESVKTKRGYLLPEIAGLHNGGTLFLDEIGETSERVQAMFLTVLETGTFVRVGGEANRVKVDVRLVCATNRNLQQAACLASLGCSWRGNGRPVCQRPRSETLRVRY